MATVLKMLRTCNLLCCLFIAVSANNEIASEPWINSFVIASKLCSENNCKYSLNVRGGEFLGHLSWRLTTTEGARGGSCDVLYPNYDLREVATNQWESSVEVVLPFEKGKIYFCLHHSEKKNSPFGGKWVHQGAELFLEPVLDAVSTTRHAKLKQLKTSEELQQQTNTWADLTHDTDVNYKDSAHPTRHERADIEVFYQGRYIPLRDITNHRVFLPSSDIRVPKSDNDNSDSKKSAHYNMNHSLYQSNSDMRHPKSDTYNIDYDPKSDNRVTDSYYMSRSVNIQKPKSDNYQSDYYNPRGDTRSSNINRYNPLSDVDNVLRRKREILKVDDISNYLDESEIRKRQAQVTHPGLTETGITSVRTDALDMVKIEGLRIEESAKEPIVENGIPSVLANTAVTLRLFGEGLSTRTVIVLTYDKLQYGQPCKFFLKGEYMAKRDSVTPNSALFDIIAPLPTNESKLYVCAKNLRPGVLDALLDEDRYYHQGSETFKTIATHQKLLPLWATLALIMFCLCFSALFSGLNLGLMSLDRTELKIISNTGTEQERKYARAIMPVRDHGNYLLCSILLGNVAVNSTFTILLDDLTSGLFAVIVSTLAIVLLGEITPQAICSRHGLMVGARSIMVTKAVMGLTAPLAYPISKLLDYFLGEEIGSVYNRERLKELVKIVDQSYCFQVTNDMNDLDRDEVAIISGALELRKKTVLDVMTKLEDAFMLPISSVLDFETMSEIVKSGYSRIPVYEGARTNIITVLFIKDLAFVDPDDNTPLRTLAQYYQNPCNFVFEDVTLDVMFKQFKDGHKGHMAFVHRINNEGEGDPFYETIGLVTLEDVIEEMIQAEIVDETDVFMDNRSKRRRNKPQHKLQDFAAFAEKHENQLIHISPQLTLATFQFLSTSVDAFKPDIVSETVLRRLLRQDVVRHIKLKAKEKRHYVFQQGKPVDYFVLILEGRAEVTVGRENLVFEAGPFTFFGVQALTQNIGIAESPTPSVQGSLQNINMDAMLRHTFVPDYSVRAVSDLYYLAVKRSLYLAAKRATLMEKGALSKGASNDQFDTEVDKLLQSVDEDLSVSGDHKTPSRQVSPNPLPVSASPNTRARFASPAPNSPERRASDAGEQDKLLN